MHKLDRFSRNRYDSAIYRKKLEKNNVRLCSVLERLDNTPESIMMESVLEGISEYYSKNLSRKVKKGNRENALRCIHNGGCCPLGFKLNDERKLVIEPHESEAVKTIFYMFANGYGYSKIAETLNNMGYQPKRGGMLSVMQVAITVKNSICSQERLFVIYVVKE